MYKMRSNNSNIYTKPISNQSNQNFDELQFKKNVDNDVNLNDLNRKNTEKKTTFTNFVEYDLSVNSKSLFFKKLTIFAVNVFLNLLMISTIVGLLIYFLGITGM